VRLVLTADLHGHLPEKLPEGDVLVIAGDICPDFALKTAGQAHWLKETFAPWLEGLPYEHVVGIAGNHDFVFETRDLVPPLPKKWHYLQDDVAIIEGYKFYGTPWVPQLQSWAFYGSPRWLDLRADAIPVGTHVLVSHGPPLGAGDLSMGKLNVGDPWLVEAIARVRPDVVVCGHIHEAYGEHECQGSPVLNVSMVDVSYDPVNHPKIFTLDP
jgi:Icc-related predicted phosphoesterase